MVLKRSDSKMASDMHSLLEHPKRTKVHAQRKFAQGSGMNSPMMTPVKEKEKTKSNSAASPPDLLPAKRPKTEDFLTFLCFRGTKALPPRLDFFNTATKSEKTDKEISTPGLSKRSPNSQENKPKINKNKVNKCNAERVIINKTQEKRLTQHSRIRNLKQKSNTMLRSHALLEGRQKKIANRGSKMQLPRLKRGHQSLLMRMGATRMRSGLRSDGELPPGSELGIKSDRKPRQDIRPNLKAAKGKLRKVKAKLEIVKKNKKCEDEQETMVDSECAHEENESEQENNQVIRKKSRRKSTRTKQTVPKSSIKNVKIRPTRKTKEAATLYMEMLNKDMRVNEDEDFEEYGSDSTIEGKPEASHTKSTLKLNEPTGKGKCQPLKKFQLNRVHHPHKSILKRLGATKIRSGLRSAGHLGLAVNDVGIKSKVKKMAVKGRKDLNKSNLDISLNDSNNLKESTSGCKQEKKSTKQTSKAKNDLKKHVQNSENEEETTTTSSSIVKMDRKLRHSGTEKLESVKAENESIIPVNSKCKSELRAKIAKESDDVSKQNIRKLKKTEGVQKTKQEFKTIKKGKQLTKIKAKTKQAIKSVKQQDFSSDGETDEVTSVNESKKRKVSNANLKLKQEGKKEPKLEESESEKESETKLERKKKNTPKQKAKSGNKQAQNASMCDDDSEDDNKEPKMPFRMSTRTRQPTGAKPPKSLDVQKRPSRKTKEAATLYMEMLTKDLRSPDDEDFEDFEFEETFLKAEEKKLEVKKDNNHKGGSNITIEDKQTQKTLKGNSVKSNLSQSKSSDNLLTQGKLNERTLRTSRAKKSMAELSDENSSNDEKLEEQIDDRKFRRGNVKKYDQEQQSVSTVEPKKKVLLKRADNSMERDSTEMEMGETNDTEKIGRTKKRSIKNIHCNEDKSSNSLKKGIAKSDKAVNKAEGEKSSIKGKEEKKELNQLNSEPTSLNGNPTIDISHASKIKNKSKVVQQKKPLDIESVEKNEDGKITETTNLVLEPLKVESEEINNGVSQNLLNSSPICKKPTPKMRHIQTKKSSDKLEEVNKRSSSVRDVFKGLQKDQKNQQGVKQKMQDQDSVSKLPTAKNLKTTKFVDKYILEKSSPEETEKQIKTKKINKTKEQKIALVDKKSKIGSKDLELQDAAIANVGFDNNAELKFERQKQDKEQRVDPEAQILESVEPNKCQKANDQKQVLGEPNKTNKKSKPTIKKNVIKLPELEEHEMAEEFTETDSDEERRRRPKRPKLTARDPDDKPYFESEFEGNRRLPFKRSNVNLNFSPLTNQLDNNFINETARKRNNSCSTLTIKHEPMNAKGDKLAIDEPGTSTHCNIIPTNPDDSDVIEALISLRNEHIFKKSSEPQSEHLLNVSPNIEIRQNDGILTDLKESHSKKDFSDIFEIKEKCSFEERKSSSDSITSQSSSFADCNVGLEPFGENDLKKDMKTNQICLQSNLVETGDKEDTAACEDTKTNVGKGRSSRRNSLSNKIGKHRKSRSESTYGIDLSSSKTEQIVDHSFSSQTTQENKLKIANVKAIVNEISHGEMRGSQVFLKEIDLNKTKPLTVEIFNDMSDLNSDSETTNLLSSNSKNKDLFEDIKTESDDSKQSTSVDSKIEGQSFVTKLSENETKSFHFKKEAKDVQFPKSELTKSKQSMNETWRQAFKNAKIPKTGQRSPAPHSVEPFVRKSSYFFKNEDVKKTQLNIAKLPNIQSFKNFSKFGNASPSRPFPVDVFEGKSNVYLSPNKVLNPREDFRKDSPSKSSVSSSEELKDMKKNDKTPVKSLTQLQYEKRSSELISSLKDTPPPLIMDANTIYLPNLQTDFKEKKQEPIANQDLQKPKTEGKHLNLPLAVEHTLRKMSPTTVSKKPVPNKTFSVDRKPLLSSSQVTKLPVQEQNESMHNIKPVSIPETSGRASTNIDVLHKKKVNMSTEEINRWMDFKSKSNYHTMGCGIFENNHCECSFRTSSASMLNSGGVSDLIVKEESKVDHGVVEPPIQLKELDSTSKMFEAQTISSCKVDEYREKILLKKTSSEEISPLKTVKPNNSPEEKLFKSDRSMTEEEMCEFDFTFEKTSNSPRESGSDMSSPTLKDDISLTLEDKSEGIQVERKSIFQQRRSGSTPKQLSVSKSPSAFSADNERSVYAFEPDLPPPTLNKPFRRRGSRVKSSDDESPSSSSIAVQVKLENEAVLESSTQTEEVLKLQNDDPEQSRIMLPELLTKTSNMITQTSSSRSPHLSGQTQKPEQKVRPLPSTSTSIATKPLVGKVQPTIRDPEAIRVQCSDPGANVKREKANQGIQLSSNIEKCTEETTVKEEIQKDDNILPTRSKSNKSRVSSVSASEFPIPGTSPCMLNAPIFRPTEKEFQDPLEYIERITPLAQSFGICKIIPPSNFKPECKISDDMRFTAYNQYVHKMLNRWGPNVKEMSAIKKYLATQSITLNQLPWIGGMEVDLPRLYQTVQNCGGLKEVIEKKRWAKVADAMKIPKSAQDRVTKLDDIYCKYLLPYDTLSHAERNKLLNEVEIEWEARERRILEEKEDEKEGREPDESDSEESDSDDRDECITKGRSMALNGFFRIARNTMAMWFKESNPGAKEVEFEFWKHVSAGVSHLCVHSGSIDSGTWGCGFPTAKTSSTSRHPWNLKVLTNNSGSILRSLGPAIGVTVPTLHVGMIFTACCWYRDPHSLPWIEYLHTGASKIWYGVPDSWCEELRSAMRNLLPRFCRDKKIWLASDTAMVPPELLIEQGVSLCRTVQEPGQFILVFPKAFTSTICTGYLVSESVYFAQPSWLNTARLVFKDIQESCEPPIFSLEKLLFNIASDIKSSVDVLNQVLPMINDLKETEIVKRKELESLGLSEKEKLPIMKGRKKSQEDAQEYECEICRAILFLSLVSNSQDDCNYCLAHAIEILQKDKSSLKHCKLMYTYDEDQMEDFIEKLKVRIEQKYQKKQGKTSSCNKTNPS
ncbi:uncharacterized protein LOC106674103 [Cimex lectularius]|uniref:Uncharacterized protein n=1 Tax=Cimex lectularius TaxID=79782 RepID=A0A8I6SS10_CIMLE|nr:uncharacterized protein LOC106674103 [Cimex lectularius]